ncbi:PIN domain-containing protein [Ilumatobacter sp.]|uniref:PIN domain-containing protein n=1 Tax=Ilumatobacter sp. TaxID=1967498 RepID=UPI0037502B3D
MTRGPVVVDTDVFSARLIANSLLGRRYEPMLAGRGEVISFQTAAELRYGALLRGWGPTRLAALERAIDGVEVVHSGDELIAIYSRLRVACTEAGHALHQREHDADRWIAATAIRLGIPLVSNDGVFHKAPGLTLETLSD